MAKTPVFSFLKLLENGLHDLEDTLHPADESPVRFEIMKETMKRGEGGPPIRMLPIIIPTMWGIRKTLKSLKDNPDVPKRSADAGLFSEIENYALELGASSVGFARVPSRWVFRNKAVLFENAIMLSMEMDKTRIDTAPSIACEKTVMETYRDLGKITNKITVWQRKRGYGGHAGHPLMGQALYPPLAQTAGLGWMGLNGILITPEHGPRVRLAAVYTSIENLPLSEENKHFWVAEFCKTCRICVEQCPPKALYDKPVDRANGQISYR
jgi:ferredoxin